MRAIFELKVWSKCVGLARQDPRFRRFTPLRAESVITKQPKTKDSKDNKQYPHHNTTAYQQQWPQHQKHPKKQTLFGTLALSLRKASLSSYADCEIVFLSTI